MGLKARGDVRPTGTATSQPEPLKSLLDLSELA